MNVNYSFNNIFVFGADENDITELNWVFKKLPVQMNYYSTEKQVINDFLSRVNNFIKNSYSLVLLNTDSSNAMFLYQNLRRMPNAENIPIIAYGNSSSNEILANLYSMGVDHIASKSDDCFKVIAALCEAYLAINEKRIAETQQTFTSISVIAGYEIITYLN